MSNGTFLQFLNDLGTALGGYSTLVIAVLTYFLWKENRLLRKVGSEPKIVVYFETHPDGTGGLNLALMNVGNGPALDVSFEFDVDREDFSAHKVLVKLDKRRAAISLIPQNQKISFLFAVGHKLFNPTILKPFRVNVSWNDLSGKERIHASYLLDVSQFAGLPGLMAKPPLVKVAEHLNGIERQIGALTRAVAPLSELIDATALENNMRSHVIGDRST